MSTKGKHRMPLAESLRRRIAARRRASRQRQETRLAEVKRAQLIRRLHNLQY